MALRAGGARRLGRVLLLALLAAGAALSWDLPQPRLRGSRIRVHPRGNLWATGKSGPGQARPTTERSPASPLRPPLSRRRLGSGEPEAQAGSC